MSSWAATVFAAISFAVLAKPVFSQSAECAVARCGASSGNGYFFWDELFNPEGPEWAEDGIANGNIVLVRLGDEWDIQFDDTAGAYGYRQDGATVLVLGAHAGKLRVGAFHSNYSDVYTFNFLGREVVWRTHKTGTLIGKVAIYRAECEFMAEIPID